MLGRTETQCFVENDGRICLIVVNAIRQTDL